MKNVFGFSPATVFLMLRRLLMDRYRSLPSS
jgi:hypothetical protein